MKFCWLVTRIFSLLLVLGFIFCDVTRIPVYLPVTMVIAESFTSEVSLINKIEDWLRDVSNLTNDIQTKPCHQCKGMNLNQEKSARN
jgi:hypothetical protein